MAQTVQKDQPTHAKPTPPLAPAVFPLKEVSTDPIETVGCFAPASPFP
jgi:hypothetical protein